MASRTSRLPAERMHFLLDANMPRSAANVIRAAGYECTHVRDTALADAPDERLASYARECGLALMTRDFDFADERRYPPQGYLGLVVLSLPETADAVVVTRLVSLFLGQRECVAALPGRLAVVEFGRIRLRPRLESDR